jgi:hypothetical protein
MRQRLVGYYSMEFKMRYKRVKNSLGSLVTKKILGGFNW